MGSRNITSQMGCRVRPQFSKRRVSDLRFGSSLSQALTFLYEYSRFAPSVKPNGDEKTHCHTPTQATQSQFLLPVCPSSPVYSTTGSPVSEKKVFAFSANDDLNLQYHSPPISLVRFVFLSEFQGYSTGKNAGRKPMEPLVGVFVLVGGLFAEFEHSTVV